MEVLKPKLYLCGHIHFPSQIIEVGGTTLVSLDSSMKNMSYTIAEFDRDIFHDIEIPIIGFSGFLTPHPLIEVLHVFL